MTRLARLALIVCAIALLVSASGAAAPRIWVGFQDDPNFGSNKDRTQELDSAMRANATVIRALVDWAAVAPTRPAHASDSFDPAYRFGGLDELVHSAEVRGAEVMLTIWGTPNWADQGAGPNHAPTMLADLTAFTHALASRYTGTRPGYPFVRFYSIWNEPNRAAYLAPQQDAAGLYAGIYRAAYAGIKSGNSNAQIAIGETSSSGDTDPAAFAELLARARPRLRFDAWALHPYPPVPSAPPGKAEPWPTVTLSQLPRFEKSLDGWFGRKGIRIWITEFFYETAPEKSNGVSYATQAAYVRQALAIAHKDPLVQMFIWSILRDDPASVLSSGLVKRDGTEKPAYAAFAAAAAPLDPRNAIVPVQAGVPNPVIRVSALPIAANARAGATIGIRMSVFDGTKPLGTQLPVASLGVDGWLSVTVQLVPRVGHRYRVLVDASDVNGNRVVRTIELQTFR
ncbi:MAG: cellulase family glycosylhydrolase [Gaiellaceae bacterium]